MAAKEYEIAFKLAGKMGGGFQQTFKQASAAVGSVQDKLTAFNKQAAQVGKLQKMRTEVGQAARAYTQAKQKVAELGRALSQTEKPTKQQIADFNQAKQAVTKAKAAVDKKRESVRTYAKSVGMADADLKQLNKRQKELKDAADKASASLDRQKKINEKLAKVNSAQGKVKSVAGFGNGALAAGGAAVGGAAAYMLKAGSDAQAALGQLQSATGATDAEMKKLSATARELYTSGMGESFDAVTKAMATVKQTSGLTGDELKNVTNRALLLSDVFEYDVQESARASSALMKHFGTDGEKAYELIAYAAQHGADKNGDLLDTFNEYSVQYKALGFSAEQFTAHLVKGAESGAFSIDKVGDAIKEFNIRSKDGSESTMEAYKNLGINGKKVSKMFAAGGKDAQKAFFEVVTAIQAIEDPVERNAAGVALFGTQFEDLEAGALDSMLAIKDASIDTAGTLEAMDKAKYGNLSSQLTIVARKFTDTLMPASQKAAATLAQSMPQVEAAIARVAPIINSALQSFASQLPAIIDSVGSAVSTAINFANVIANNWGWIGPIVKGVVASFLGLKALAFLSYPVLSLYKGFLNLKKAIDWCKNSTKLHTAATKAATIAQKLWNGAISTVKLAAQKAALIANKAVILAHTAATKAAALAQRLWNGAINVAKLIAHKVALIAHKAVMLAWAAACRVAAVAQRLFTGALSVAKLVAQKVALIAHKAAMIAWTVACKAAAIAQRAFSAAVGLLSGPVGIAVAAIAALIAIGVLLYKNWDKVKAKCQELWAAFAAKFPGMASIVQGAFSAMQPVISGLKTMLGGVIDFVAGVFTGNWSRAWNGIKDIFGGAWEALKGLAKAPLNAVISMVNKAIGGLNGLNVKIPDWVPGMGGKSFGLNIPTIPGLAEGGVVTQPTVAMIGEGRESEAVLPLSKLGSMMNSGAGGGMTVNFAPVINVSGSGGNVYEDTRRAAGESMRDLKRELSRLMQEKRRTSYA